VHSYVDLELGADAQDEFTRLLIYPDGATRQEDMHDHWDVKGVFRDLSGSVLRFDVKDNLDRHHQSFPVEIQNVHGAKGWLYGNADCLAFHHPTSFTIVWRFRLVKLVERLMQESSVTPDEYITDKWEWSPLGHGDPKSQVYSRKKWDRDDRVVMVHKNDMWNISSSRPRKKQP
jgi:hypothetical protein